MSGVGTIIPTGRPFQNTLSCEQHFKTQGVEISRTVGIVSGSFGGCLALCAHLLFKRGPEFLQGCCFDMQVYYMPYDFTYVCNIMLDCIILYYTGSYYVD